MVLLALLALGAAHGAALDILGYRAQPRDFSAFQDGLKAVLEVEEQLFPEGVGTLDAAFYDSRDVFLYSRRKDYPLPKLKTWKGFQVYALPHEAKLPKSDFQGCSAGDEFVYKALDGKVPRKYLTCAPLTTFVAIQKTKKASIYTTRESYLATIVHEFGHLYQDAQPKTLPIVEEMAAALDARVPSSSDLGHKALKEGFAIWAELTASKRLFKKHWKRLRQSVDPQAEDRHGLGLWAALEAMKREER